MLRACTTGCRHPSTCTEILQKAPPQPVTTPDPSSPSSTTCGACSQAKRRGRLPLYGALRGDGGGRDPVRARRRNRLPPKVRAICSPKIPSSLFKYSIRAPHPTLDSVTMSRQAWKGAAAAAAAARNLLKLDAARGNKAAAARKDAAHLRICRRPEQRS